MEPHVLVTHYVAGHLAALYQRIGKTIAALLW